MHVVRRIFEDPHERASCRCCLNIRRPRHAGEAYSVAAVLPRAGEVPSEHFGAVSILVDGLGFDKPLNALFGFSFKAKGVAVFLQRVAVPFSTLLSPECAGGVVLDSFLSTGIVICIGPMTIPVDKKLSSAL